jgi:catechol-2,3-dioxygenase
MSYEVMLDLETLGTGPTAPIIAIGAVAFDPYADRVEALHEAQPSPRLLYSTIAFSEALQFGDADGSTIEWWFGQSEEARKGVTDRSSRSDFRTALIRLDNMCERADGVWGNGATFGNVAIRNALKAVGLMPSWSFRKDKCYRTVVGLLPKSKLPEFVRHGTYHNALDDAISQAVHLQKIYKVLGLREAPTLDPALLHSEPVAQPDLP